MPMIDEKKHGYISLLQAEQTLISVDSVDSVNFHPISTLTWFHAPVHTRKLREKAADIILKNPWLAASLKKDTASELWGLEYSNIPDLDAAKSILEEKGLFCELVMKPGEVNIDPTVHSWTEQDRIIARAWVDLNC